jgi:hypothetical protein
MKVTKNERLELHEFINENVDIPYIPEPIEGFIFDKGIDILEQVIDENLPEYASELFRNAEKGFNKETVKPLKQNIITLLQNRVNIPILNKETEDKLFSVLVNVLLSALEVDKKLGNLKG